MWPFKSKYEKLKREDVVEAICDLEKQENDLESAIVERARTIDELLEKGRKETNRELKLFYAKKNYFAARREPDRRKARNVPDV